MARLLESGSTSYNVCVTSSKPDTRFTVLRKNIRLPLLVPFIGPPLLVSPLLTIPLWRVPLYWSPLLHNPLLVPIQLFHLLLVPLLF